MVLTKRQFFTGHGPWCRPLAFAQRETTGSTSSHHMLDITIQSAEREASELIEAIERREAARILCLVRTMAVVCAPCSVAALLFGGFGWLSDGRVVPEFLAMGVIFAVLPMAYVTSQCDCAAYQSVRGSTQPTPEVSLGEIELQSVASQSVHACALSTDTAHGGSRDDTL